MQISGSSAIVVGGAGGLGEATVRRLHAAGARVVIADLADDKGKELASELDARYVRTDATNTDDVQAALAEAESLGPLRISVDAHGGPASGGRLVGKDGSPLDLDGFKTTIDVYLTGVFNVLRLAAAAMARQEPVDGGRGVIVNTASIAAYEGQIGQLPYAAAKGGVVSMTLVAARDLSPLGIRVVTIAPGTFLTPAYGKAGDQLEAYWGPQIPYPKRMGRSAEYGAFVQSIIENDYLNGEVIRLDGALRFPAGGSSRLRGKRWRDVRACVVKRLMQHRSGGLVE
jgi:NAD(P)-dependent dehydrogenase (short-subunit alcohol dehydrogenase family)